jgi:hypothetical protein
MFNGYVVTTAWRVVSGEELQMWKVTASKLNKQLRADTR